MVDHSHWPEAVEFVKRNWFWLSSAGVVAYYTIKWSILQVGTNVLGKHATHADLNKCQQRVTAKFTADLENHEEMAFARFDRSERQNHAMFDLNRREVHEANQQLAHSIERVEDKINMLVSKLLDK